MLLITFLMFLQSYFLIIINQYRERDRLLSNVLNLLHIPRNTIKNDLSNFIENRAYDEIKILNMHPNNLGDNYNNYKKDIDQLRKKYSSNFVQKCSNIKNNNESICQELSEICQQKYNNGLIDIQLDVKNNYIGIIENQKIDNNKKDNTKIFYEPTIAKLYFKNYTDTKHAYFLAGKKFKGIKSLNIYNFIKIKDAKDF